ncbi:MAG: molybdate ABC transporter substrate-binding protein [Rubellimicrobium sp.]|nr:molybdate ABC transporter substrate-binding protein [Rubellimicrobium sp.]
MRHPLLSLALAAALSLPLPVLAGEVTVFAAASMKNALDAVAAGFTAATGDEVVISYAGSNQLASQILEGAPADIFISAAVNWMDAVDEAGLIAPGNRVDLLGNSLVLIGAADAAPVAIGPETDIPALLDGGVLAMAMVDSVPAGQYGKAALESLGLWEAVAPHVAQTDNVRAALLLVATGEAPYGITYATDAAAEDAVRIVGTFPDDTHPPIIYPAALLGEAAPASAFFQALMSDEAGAIFTGEGFVLLTADE